MAKFKYILLYFALIALGFDAQSQGSRPIIQFSGIIIGEDSTSGVPGVYIFVPKAGRGTTSNFYGYFTMPALSGDSVIISAVGFKKQYFIVPNTKAESFTVIIELLSDTTYLPTVEIFPYPTEELFKEAILALKLPSEYGNMANSMNADVMALMLKNMPMDGTMNHQFYMQQQQYYTNSRYGYQPNQLLNPFAWAQFIKSIKRGDLKRK